MSGLAAAGPRPEAAKAASEQQAAAGAAEAPDGLQGEAAAEVPGGPQGEAEAVAALPGAAVLRPAEELQAAGAVQPPAAQPRGVRVLQAAPRLAVPSAAASVFRQGPRPAAGPERRRTAQRLAHAMRCWPIASRSEPSSQAARNEGWSCGEFPRKVLCRSVGMNGQALGRIVAGDATATRFISARKSSHYGNVHCAFRRWWQSPDIASLLHA
ncbi:hypothetical protein GA0061099_1002403 [Bradyrhizobium yuanmingense]|uniref:Uncharacterized protein n=1 Tax=Bradyrhizobium yuanmingense TaxID=108015 RepID=A0A1C3UNP1_9BRAD|nr:hypothetical protein IQ15_00547 [Bradyrhizobium yuanmingense]SCB17078.1 hypothetical protein GA0061099_1002403 [Bradyrhizobium yuanmingense]